MHIKSNHIEYVDSFVQDCSNTIAYALELLQSCTKPSMSSASNRTQHIL